MFSFASCTSRTRSYIFRTITRSYLIGHTETRIVKQDNKCISGVDLSVSVDITAVAGAILRNRTESRIT